jgi:hypothetical protein
MVTSGLLGRLETTLKQMESQIRGVAVPIILTILASIMILSGPAADYNRFHPEVFPVDAIHWLEKHPPQGRMFNSFDWGGYILLHLWPEQKTFIESHTDVTGEATQQYELVITLQDGWQDLFERYNITWAIIPPSWPLTAELTARGWKTVYQDQTTIILAK